jgi:hypothetical protein
VLKKLAPAIVMVCPAEPLEGLNAEISGGPAGATATLVVEVVVDDEGGAEVLVEPPPADERGPDGAGRAGGALDRSDRGGDEAGLASNETTKATAAAATRTATAATDPNSQRWGSVGGGPSVGLRGRTTGTGVVGCAGGEMGWPRGGVGAGSGGTPADSRARRTTLSMAQRAR